MKKLLALAVCIAAVVAVVLLIVKNSKGGSQPEVQEPTEAEDDDAKYATALLKPGTEAPDFTLKTPEGKEVSLSDYRGQYVVLDFWASWCPDCRKDIPQVKAMHEAYTDVVFLSVSFDTEAEKWTKCIDENQMDWVHVSPLTKWKTKNDDGTQQVLIAVAEDYHVEWIPSMYLINPEGKVVIGTVMSEKISNALATISPRRASE